MRQILRFVGLPPLGFAMRFAALLLGLAPMGLGAARAQCVSTSTVAYTTAPAPANDPTEKRAATETVAGINFTYGGYNVANNGSSVLDIFQHTTDYPAQISGPALVWRQQRNATVPAGTTSNTDVDNNTPFRASVTLTFDREVTGLTFTIQDIDKGFQTNGTPVANGGSTYTDEVLFSAQNGAGTAVVLPTSGVTWGSNKTSDYIATTFAAGAATVTAQGARGTSLNGSVTAANANGTTTFRFPGKVKTVTMYLRNLNTQTSTPAGTAPVRLQTIGIQSIDWCGQADVTTTLAGPGTLLAGVQSANYTATYANNGPGVAVSTTRTVTVPANTASAVATGVAGATVVGSQAGGWTITFPAGTNVPSGNTVSYAFTVTPAAVASLTVTSNTTTTDDEGANTAANSASVTTTVTPVADLTTTLAGPGSLTAGLQSGNYTVTYTNNGPSVAASTTRTVTIPSNGNVSSVSAPGATVTGTAATNWTITFPAGTNVPAGNTVSYNFTVTPSITSTGNAITATSNTAPGTGGTSQGADAAANSASVSYTVGAVADVSATFNGGQADNSTVGAGTLVTYGVTFANNGPSTANGVTRTVSIPAGVPSVTATGGTVTGSQAAGYTITYPGGSFAPLNSVNYSFTIGAPATGPITLTAATTTTTNQGANVVADSNTRTLNVTPVVLSGTVYDDVNYGGGAGRTLAAANTSATGSGFANNAIGRAGATVEIYNSTGAFVGSTTTGANGAYSYNLPVAGAYTVRVVNSTVTSVRTPAATGVVPVQTYVFGDPNRVGGENPQYTDAAANTGSQTLASLSNGTVTPQSIFNATFSAASTTGVDFGFNFDVVANTNNAGQGSLRQFIVNANALANTNLNQSPASTGGADPVAGVETSIFMVPDGLAHAGLRAGLTDQLTVQTVGGTAYKVAVITPVTGLPALAGANSPFTSIDGTTQTQNVGNTNNTTLGAGGTVGTGTTALSQLNGPEVQILGSTAIALGLDVAATATNTTIKGLAILDFGNGLDSNDNANIRSAANNVLITQNVVGTTASSFTLPATRTNADNVRLTGGTSGVTVSNNLIGFGNSKGVAVGPAVVGATVTGNEIRSNGFSSANFDGVDIQGSNASITNNLLTGTSGQGVDSYRSAGGNTISGNTITDNGRGTTTIAPNETPGVRIYGAGNTISQNIIADNYGAGVMLEGTTNGGAVAAVSTTTISQNSIYNNGTVLGRNGAAATGQVGIDLEANGDNEAAGSAPYVTLNDNGDTDSGANGLLNFPVLATARVVGTDLVLEGFARPGAKIELFATGATPDARGFGEGRTYLTTFTEGNTNAANGLVDNSAGTGSYGPANVNGLNQGTDDTNRFSFTIPLSSLPGGVLPAGTILTSTATLNNSTSEFSGNIGLNVDVTTTISGPNVLAAGQPSGTFTATFSNAGSAPAADVAQTVTLPVGATLTGGQLATIQGNYPGATYSGGSGGTLTFAQAATLAAGASNVFQFVFTAPTTSGAASIASNVATATAQSPNTAPDAASFALNVTAVADVAATVTGSAPTAVPAGTQGTFNVSFANLAATGPQTATGVTATVQLPAGLDTGRTTGLVSASNGGVYDNATGLVSYAGLTTLTSGQSVASVITYTQPAQGNVTATAAINTATNQAGQTANDTQAATNVGSSGFDLATTLSGPASAVAGTQVTYAVTTANNGPGAAPNAVQTVSIPTPVALTNVFLTNGGTYSFSNGTSLFTFPTIPALGSGQQVNNSISFTSPASGTSALAVTALVTPNTPTAGDASTANNQVSIVTNLTPAPAAAGNTANVYVTIASDAPTSGVAPNAPVTFTVKQGNNGPNPATTVATQVYLPTGLSGVVVKDKNGVTLTNSATSGYNAATGVVVFPIETSEASAIAPLTYTIQVTAPASGVITATAAVSTGTNDPVAADNVALTAVTVNLPVLGDVATALSGPATATPGESLVYTVASTNRGTTSATNVEQTVQLPAGLVGVEVRDANGNLIANSATLGYDAATGLVTFAPAATLGAGASLVRTITLPAPDNSGSATGYTFVPVASVSSTSADVVPANNKASVTTTVKPTSDFAVTLSGPATTVVGNPVTYTVTTTNNGASVGGQQTTVQLPAGLNATGAGLVLPTGATYDNATGVLTLAAAPAQGLGLAQARTSSVTFNMPAGLVVLAPTAQVTPAANTNDANLANNAATATTTVTPATEAVIDLATTVVADQPSRLPGQAVVFTVTSLNNTAGNSATGVVQQLALVPGLVGTRIDGVNPTSTTNGISLYPGGATYNANTGIVTFPPVTVTNGTPVERTVRVAAPGEGPLVATASIRGSQSEVATANNTANASVTISPRADVLTVTTGPDTTQPGTPVSYSLATTNNGASAAVNVVPTLTLPAGFSNVVLPAGASLSGNTVTFATVASLASGQTTTNTVTFTSPAAAGTYAVNGSSTSTVVGATPATVDPATGNNASSASTTSTAPTAAPVAFNVVNKTTYNATNGTVNSPSANTAGQNLILPFSAAASTGQTVATYTVTSLPTAAQGTLSYFNGTAYVAVPLNQPLSPTEAATLKFDPADDATSTASVGNVTFSYVATDNLGKVSNTALYTIPVADDINSVYTATPNKGGVNQYQTNDVLAFVTDANGAAYNGSGLVYNPSGTTANILAAGGNNGLTNQPNSVVQAPSGQGPAASGLYPANPTNALPAGVSLNTTTGLVFVSNRALLVNNPTVQYYQINVITTDIYGGTNVVPAQFSIGAYPLPVELTAFEAQAVQNRDAKLTWRTASEKNNARFDVERSFTGTDFAKIGTVKGQGTTSAATDYAWTDAAVATKATGPVYYRLKQVDADGTASFSPVRTVAFTKEAVAAVPAISVFPNPATAATKLDLTLLPAGSYQVSLLDATGRVVLRATRAAGLAETLDLNSIASGTYTVLVRGQHNGQVVNLTTRLVKE